MRSIILAQKSGPESDGFIKGFQNQGYTVLAAHNGRDTLQLLNSNKPPTVIILNSLLEDPGVSDVCQYVRKKHKFSKTLIFLLAETPVDNKENRELGIDKVLTKPFSSYEIHQLISSLTATASPQSVGALNLNRQVTGVTVAITIFVAVVVYFVIIPMILTAKSGKKNMNKFKKNFSISAEE